GARLHDAFDARHRDPDGAASDVDRDLGRGLVDDAAGDRAGTPDEHLVGVENRGREEDCGSEEDRVQEQQVEPGLSHERLTAQANDTPWRRSARRAGVMSTRRPPRGGPARGFRGYRDEERMNRLRRDPRTLNCPDRLLAAAISFMKRSRSSSQL